MKVQHFAVSENRVHDSCDLFTLIWTWNFLHSRQTLRNLQHDVGLHVTGFYSKRTVNIGDVSITEYFVAEVWFARDGDMSCVWNRVGSQVCLFLSTLCWYPFCVCLHCTVPSAYTSVHNFAKHMSLALQLLSSVTVGPLVPYKSCVSHFMYRCRTCVDCDSTIWYSVYLFHRYLDEVV